jgi:VWFA-related protein
MILGALARVGLLVVAVASAQIPPQQDPSFIKHNFRVVELNVAAIGPDGNPVTDLAKTDFSIKENGVDLPVITFAVQRAARKTQSLPPSTFTNKAEQSASSVTIVLFDMLNTNSEDESRARAQLLKSLTTLDADEPVAVFALRSKLVLLSDFTSAVDAHSGKLADFLNRASEPAPAYSAEVRTAMTGEALEAIAAHISRIHGRKNLIWIAGQFPDPGGIEGPRRLIVRSAEPSSKPDQTRALRALSEENIAAYPVAVHEPPAEDRDAIAALGEVTGGREPYRLEDLSTAFHDAALDARLSYVFVLGLMTSQADGKYHPLEIAVNRANVRLHARQGYLDFPNLHRFSLADSIVNNATFTGVGLNVQARRVDKLLMLEINVDARDLTFVSRAGKMEVVLQFAVSSGEYRIEREPKSYKITLTRASYEEAQTAGLPFTINIAAQAAGSPYHIGFRDNASGAIGTIHIVVPAQARKDTE